MPRFRLYNTVRTDDLEMRIGTQEAKGDSNAAQVLRTLARDIGVPDREQEIAAHKARVEATLREWAKR